MKLRVDIPYQYCNTILPFFPKYPDHYHVITLGKYKKCLHKLAFSIQTIQIEFT